jgi:pimeloyl-ACP methyl ester carboxylesterase
VGRLYGHPRSQHSPTAVDAYFAGASFTADRDLVLVDTRGTGASTPYLGCPELDEAEVTSFYSGPTVNVDALHIYRPALRECRHRLTAQGIDLASYNSAESAADIEALRKALGVERWNLLAASADGTLGLTYMRLFPKGIRRTIIDSGMSTQMLWGPATRPTPGSAKCSSG